MLFRSTIRSERLRQGKTLRDVCASAYISLGYLSEIELGKKELASEFLEQIAYALGMEAYELVMQTSLVMSGTSIPDTIDELLLVGDTITN